MAAILPRVVLTGSESTGKTTLAALLAERYRTIWVPEFSREYAEARGGLLSAADVEPIARGQLAAERAGEQQARGLLILDTDLLSTLVYARHYYDRSPAWITDLLRDRQATLYLLCATDLPWVADGVRDRGEARGLMQALFRQTLEEFRLPQVAIAGAGQRRGAAAITAVEQWLAGGNFPAPGRVPDR